MTQRSPAFLRFKRDLLSWSDRIKRAAYLVKLEVKDLPNGDFSLTGHWTGGSFTRVYTQPEVLGKSLRFPFRTQRPERPVCNHRDDFVREVLAARGV